jgi:2-oxo-3-hexenedioate decarboxylase
MSDSPKSEAESTAAIQEMAGILDRAMLEGREIERLSARFPSLTLETAYQVQDAGVALREARGEKYFGLKMGFTSEAKRVQMGLHSPIYGVLTDRMRVQGGQFSLKGSIHPKIEPEIAFFVERELKGKISAEEALNACSGICAAMEILDSRFEGFKYFSLPDVVADNCSSSHYILGDHVLPASKFTLDSLAQLEMSMDVDGKTVQSARASAISGNPVNSLIELCALLASRGRSLPAGSLVLAGAATQAVPLERGSKIRLTAGALGQVSLQATE